ncbi:MAG: CinA family protein [Steroidobacteraceae bacterium]
MEPRRDTPSFDPALDRLIRRLLADQLTVATAESCTGGWLAKVLTDRAGSSAWLLAGWVVYSNESKQRELSVPTRLLRQHGAVSEEVAAALAKSAQRQSGADLAVAISGIAGPSGAVPGKPVGTVCFGFARKHGRGSVIETVTKRFRGDRDTVRRAAVRYALIGLYSMASKGSLYSQ